jgi:protein SCO1/2
MWSLGRLLAVIFFLVNPVWAPVWAYNPNEVVISGHDLPKEFKDVGVDEHLGLPLDLNLEFTDDEGVTGPLGRFFAPGKPVLMAMVYYSCPSLCNFHLNGLTDTMKRLQWSAGDKFQLVAVSMDVSEKAELAAKKKINYLKAYGRAGAERGWHFLVGNKDNVNRLAEQLGFKFKWIEEKSQFSHPSVAYVITPEGRISRYLHGIQPDPTTLRMSLLEASNGSIGTVIDQVLMFCFQFDPKKNKYSLYAWNLMRIGAILMVLLLAVLMLPVWWREHVQNRTRT